MPRRSAADTMRTRSRIVEHAMEVASRQGLEGLTIGSLATDLAMSKAGLIAHFGSKERLQLATLEAAIRVFRREVVDRAAGMEPGLARLTGLCAAWISYLGGAIFPGGCFLTTASVEFDARGGPVRDAVRVAMRAWHDELERHARIAVEAGDLPADTDPAQVAFELDGVAMAANQAIQLYEDPRAAERARRAMGRLLGVTIR